MNPDRLEDRTIKEEKKLSAKEKAVDTGGAVSYSLVAGILLDCASGLDP